MKTAVHLSQPNRQHLRGFSVLIIMALLACMAILLAVNSTSLHSLKQDLRLLDQEQQQKYGQSVRH